MTWPPVASSSRLRLDAMAPPLPPPPPPSTARRRRAWRRNSPAVVAFVLVLTAPYLAAATPVRLARALARGHDPQPPPTWTPTTTPKTSPAERLFEYCIVGSLRLLQSSVRFATQRLVARQESWPELDTYMRKTVKDGVVLLNNKYYKLNATMSPGFVVLSYFISFVGSICTLELLLRRTSNRGASNLLLLACAGICFGAVSTFAMHFVGNQSLALHYPNIPAFEGYTPLHLSYKAGYTILSLVASCVAMTFAFFVMGTDIRFREWRSWPCMPGRAREKTMDVPPGLAGDDYTRWKMQKDRLRKSTTNVATIFQQAGMVASWPLGDTSRNSARRSWRGFRFEEPPVSPVQPFDPSIGNDEDMLVKRDRDLGELDFRLGRAAVREEIDRRQTMIGTTPEDSASASVLQSPAPSVHGHQASHTPDLPASPLAAYYLPHHIGRKNAPPPLPLRPPSPSEVFPSTYQFPPRTPVDGDSSQVNLIPRPDAIPPCPPPPVVPWPEVSPDAVFPTVPRRASLPPTINAPPPPRVPQPLSRIQSLAEQEHDLPAPHYCDKEDPNQFSESDETRDPSSDMNNDLTIVSPEVAYFDDDVLGSPTIGWRDRLRAKVKAGEQLTRSEKMQRFFGMDIVTWGDLVKILLTGMLAGWGVAAMHYIGQVSITGIPYIAYNVGYVVGSVVIACGAVIIALYIMFIILRPKLKHSWVSKIGVAIILAGAVCGMHYSAMMGTTYGWDLGHPRIPGNDMTKRAITGLVAALAFVACLAVTAFILINSIRDRKQRARRRRVVVASVLLDNNGRMLVSAIDGLLPMCDIASLTPAETKIGGTTTKDNASTVDTSALGVDLTAGNDAFVQAMRMSWSWRNPFWSSMNPFASKTDFEGSSPEMMLNPPPVVGDFSVPPVPQRRASNMTAAESLYSTIAVSRASVARFLEMFAVAATQLSVRLTGQSEGISRLGVLYDQILTTGWVRLHNGKDTVSKGQLIFLVRRVNSSQERSDLLSRHFIFADTGSVAMSLHRTLSTPYEHVMPFLENMRLFCDNTMRMTLRPNTLYAGVTIVQATPFDGLRILLNEKNRAQLPMREVCTFSTLPGLPVNVSEGLAGTIDEIGEAVTWLEGMNLLSVITRNMSAEAARVGGPRVGRLLAALERAIVPMLDELLSADDMAYILPRLTLHPVLVPLTPATPARKGQPGWTPPHIIVFYANYDVAVNNFGDKWLPFKLFRVQHECVMASKISALTRQGAVDTPSVRMLRAPSPAISPGPSIASSFPGDGGSGRYSYARRPSKVQFEVPDPVNAGTGYTFPPREPGSTPVSSNGNPHNSVYSTGAASTIPSPTTTNSFPTWSSRDRTMPRRSSLARSMFRDETPEVQLVRPGVAAWDPNWLLHLLRTRLRAEP